MALIKVTLSKKTNDDDNVVDIKPLTTIARIREPRIVAKNWYQVNIGNTLVAIVTINGLHVDLERYDVISFVIEGYKKEYTIFNTRQLNRYSTELEVGI